MKRYIAISLSLITILICSWQFINSMQFLDIPTNKNDSAANWEKQKITKDPTLTACEKTIRINQITIKRQNEKATSAIAFQTQFVVLLIVGIQFILLIFIFFMPKKPTLSK